LDRAAVDAARENYARWVSSAHLGAFTRRTAERNAAFLLPHLKPGMHLLDAGCGPGAITLGLAAAVAPGHVTGVDVHEPSLELARALALERGVQNVTFGQHHLRALPYDEGTFDAVFMHAVLQHVDEPEAILRELRRVMKPGAIIGVGDADFDGAIFYPDDPLLARSTEVLIAVRPEGNPRVGKKLRALLAEAGFERCIGMAASGVEGDSVTTAYNGAFWARRFQEEPLVAYAEAIGAATREEMSAIADAWQRWGQHPGAFAARFWCQAIAFKPQ
jgi:ubiquinone/menaquinone biosynthesis C-methylase UbiE